MAIANLYETLLNYTHQKNYINLRITELNNKKMLSTLAQRDISAAKSAGRLSIMDRYKKLFDENPEYQEKYNDYTQMPDFNREMDQLTAYFEDLLAEQAYKEERIDAEIATESTRLQEIDALEESFKSMLTSNIQTDLEGLGK